VPVTNRYFVEPSGGTDSVAGVANGRDPLGLSVVNATYDHTGNGEGERHLFLTGAFSSYTFTAGDTIYLLNAAGGVSTGLYEIASKVDADAILLIADSGLTADSTSDVDSADDPWLTTQFAADQVSTAGSEVYMMATATETPSAQVDFDSNAGTSIGSITFTAAGTTGIALTTGFYVVSGTSLPANTDLIDLAIANLFIVFNRIRFTQATRDNIHTLSAVFPVFNYCRIDNATSDGVYSTSTTDVWVFNQTEIDNNGGRGLGVNNPGRGNYKLFGSSVHDNGTIGIEAGGDAGVNVIRGNEIYDNGTHQVSVLGSVFEVSANTIYGGSGTGSGVRINSSVHGSVFDNTISGNGAYGVDLGTGSLATVHNNHYNGNTSGQWSSGNSDEDGLQTGDPQFTSTTNGSEDFIPASGSPLDRNGTLGVDIGARKAADPAGGGGLLTHPGMTGGMRG